MASLKTSFRSFVLVLPTVGDALGESFYWNRKPDSPKYPCVRATVVTDNTLKSHSRSSLPTRSGIATIQLDVFHTDSIEVERAAEIIADALHEYSGSIGDYSDCVVTAEDKRALPEPEARSFREIIELKVRYA